MKKMWLIILIPIVFLLALVIVFLVQRSQVEFHEEEEQREMEVSVITAKEAKELMETQSGYVILDVREPDEFAQGYIPGAMNLSYTLIGEKAQELLADKEQLILVYCRSGRRSNIAAQSLAKMGYRNVKDFGGILDWPYEVAK